MTAQRHIDKAREVLSEIMSIDKNPITIIAAALAEAEGRWIPVSERLPENARDVLVCYEIDGVRCVGTGYFDMTAQWNQWHVAHNEAPGSAVVAWRDKPRPLPKEGT